MHNNLIISAAHFATACHNGQLRKYTHQPYINHPMRVAGMVTMHPLATPHLVAAAWLHDVIEDCNITKQTIANMFGEVVAEYVDALTNKSKSTGLPRAERKKIDRERIARIPYQLKVVKMIDRIDNLREIDPSDKFAKVYVEESALLLEVVKEGDKVTAAHMENEIQMLRSTIKACQGDNNVGTVRG